MTTATDPDAPRSWGFDRPSEAAPARMVPGLLEALTADEGDLVELPDFHELPEDLSSEDLLVQVVPEMADEFTCSACFLVQHRSRRSRTDPTICIDCQ